MCDITFYRNKNLKRKNDEYFESVRTGSQKWENYYDVILSQRVSRIKEESGLNQPVDFLASSKTTSVPKESSSEAVKVKLVSHVKQTNDQVVSELRRDSESDTLKASVSGETNRRMKSRGKKGKRRHSTKQNRKSKNRKSGKRKNKINKKRVVKRRIKDIFTL